ncbi:MAG: hypothetical protein FJ225_11650 [Lentisphaerae bacterium]|nr:hypothetical protein [Lentisphaerota bacterium]
MRAAKFIEILTPRQSAEDLDSALAKFAERYRTVIDNGYVVSVPDNPMGVAHFQVTEIISELGLPVPPGQVLLHLNTFHKKDDLDAILRAAAKLGIRNVLLITGDGSERLPKIPPESIGAEGASATSVDLLRYVDREFKGAFHRGVAFNQYEPQDHEIAKLKRKLAAGAEFAVTQPVLVWDKRIEKLREFGVPVAVGAWMSKNLDLLAECVGYPLTSGSDGPYDPAANLVGLRRAHPDFGVYLALLSFKNQLALLPQWLGAPSHADD